MLAKQMGQIEAPRGARKPPEEVTHCSGEAQGLERPAGTPLAWAGAALLPQRRGWPSRARPLDRSPPALAPRPSQEPSLASCCSAGPELPQGSDTRPIVAVPSSRASSRPVSVQPPPPTGGPAVHLTDFAPPHALTATSPGPTPGLSHREGRPPPDVTQGFLCPQRL